MAIMQSVVTGQAKNTRMEWKNTTVKKLKNVFAPALYAT